MKSSKSSAPVKVAVPRSSGIFRSKSPVSGNHESFTLTEVERWTLRNLTTCGVVVTVDWRVCFLPYSQWGAEKSESDCEVIQVPIKPSKSTQPEGKIMSEISLYTPEGLFRQLPEAFGTSELFDLSFTLKWVTGLRFGVFILSTWNVFTCIHANGMRTF